MVPRHNTRRYSVPLTGFFISVIGTLFNQLLSCSWPSHINHWQSQPADPSNVSQVQPLLNSFVNHLTANCHYPCRECHDNDILPGLKGSTVHSPHRNQSCPLKKYVDHITFLLKTHQWLFTTLTRVSKVLMTTRSSLCHLPLPTFLVSPITDPSLIPLQLHFSLYFLR